MYRSAFGRNKYEVGETVFAKIPGFPYWPAKIWSVIKGSPDKVRYEVYIYGFKQIRVLKEHRLCKSMEIMKLDRLKMTNKWFRKAVEDFERDVNIMTTILNEMAQLRLSDEPLKRDCKAIKGKPDGDVISATDPLGLQIDIPLNLNRPNFADDKRATEWNVIVLQQAYLLKARIERGETVSAHQEMDDWTKSKAFEVRRGLLLERKRQARIRFFKTESRMVNLHRHVKLALNSEAPHPGNCVFFLSQLFNLPITPLMLKKHPQVLKTICEIRSYFHKNGSWNMSHKPFLLELFTEVEIIFYKFKNLLKIDTDEHVAKIFKRQLRIFRAKTSRLCHKQFMSLTREPL
ncbi:uncharacterized protein [Rhodnius prolixus]|uniref:uncharacterized protein n=1 Tax=Rhodnius prolixus TaxID=13249 RepID=UPI003D189716